MHTHSLQASKILLALVGAALISVSTGCGPESPASLIAKGQADLANKDGRSAAIRFKAALQAEPDVTATRVLLGRALLEAGDAGGAAVELSKALDQNAKQAEVMPLLARALLESGQFRRITAQYSSLKFDDKAAEADFKSTLAAAWAYSGDMTKAEAAVDLALGAVPDSSRALVLKGRILTGRGDTDGALALAEKVLARDGRMHEAWQLKGELLTATRGNPEAAAQAFMKALEFEKAFVPAHGALIMQRVQLGDMKAASKQLDALRAVAPNNPEAVFVGAQFDFFNKDYGRAREAVQQLLRVASENAKVLQLAAAIEWQGGGSLVLAERQLSTAIQLEPNLVEARINLAHLRSRLGRPDRALEVLQPLLVAPTVRPAALAAAGEASLQLGDPGSAETYFSRAAQAAPEDARNRTAMALAQLARGDATTAFSQLELLAAKSQEAYVDTALVSARLARSELDAALTAADGLVRKLPNDASAAELRGRVLAARNDDSAARQSFQRALELEPRFLAALISLADIDVREKKFEDARVRIEQFLKIEPRNYLAIMALADTRYRMGAPLAEVGETIGTAIKAAPVEPAPRLKLIELLAAQRQIKAALNVAQEAVAALPNDTRILDALGRMQVADGDTEQALSTFRRVSGLEPRSAAAQSRLADVHRSMGNKVAAVASFRRAIELDPQFKAARINLIELLLEDKRSKEALEIAKDLQRRDPVASGGYLMEGAIHRKMKNDAAAAIAYRLGLKRAGEKGELVANLYASLLALGDWKEAESTALGWLVQYPGDGAMHYNLGEGYMKRKDFEAAEKSFAAALALRPDYPPALNNMALMLVRRGKSGAVAYAERAVALLPNQPALLDTLATALAAAKQFPQALATQQKAVSIAPSDPALRLNLAKIAVLAGDKVLAKSELDRLVAMGSRNPLRDEASQMLKEL